MAEPQKDDIEQIGAVPTLEEEGLDFNNDDDVASAVGFGMHAGNTGAADWGRLDAFKPKPDPDPVALETLPEVGPSAEALIPSKLMSPGSHDSSGRMVDHTVDHLVDHTVDHSVDHMSGSPGSIVEELKEEVGDTMFNEIAQREHRDELIKCIKELCLEKEEDPPKDMEEMTNTQLEMTHKHLQRSVETMRKVERKVKNIGLGLGVMEVVMNKFGRKFVGDMSGFKNAMMKNEGKIKHDIGRIASMYHSDNVMTPEQSLATTFKDNFVDYMYQFKLQPLASKWGFSMDSGPSSTTQASESSGPPPVALPSDSDSDEDDDEGFDNDAEEESDDDDKASAAPPTRVTMPVSRPRESSELTRRLDRLEVAQEQSSTLIKEMLKDNEQTRSKIDALVGALGALTKSMGSAAPQTTTSKKTDPEFTMSPSPRSVGTVGTVDSFAAFAPN